MAFFNYVGMQVSAKIVYYGPGLCGKTTNLQQIYHKTAGKSRGEMVSLETESDRTLFFDLLPIDVGTLNGFKIKFQLYTVPGQVFYNETRKMVLKGVDGIVFVADSQPLMMDSNLESLQNLRENLEQIGLKPAEVPTVFQFNKRDLEHAVSLETLNEALNPGALPFFEAAALRGEGVFETLRGVSSLTLEMIRRRLAEESGRSKSAAQIVRIPPLPPAAAPLQPSAPPPSAPVPGYLLPPASSPPPVTPHQKRTSRDLEELLAMVTGKKKPAAPPPPPRPAASPAPPSAPEPAGNGVISRELDLALAKIARGKLQKLRVTLVADDGDRIERFENALTIEADGTRPIALKIRFKDPHGK